LPPVFARVAEESEDCRAGALAKAHLFRLVDVNAASYDSAIQFPMGNFFYFYVLQSEIDPKRFCTGLTNDLPHRLQNHNAGRVLHTAKWKRWRLKTYIAIYDLVRAAKLERYLKSASGRAFLKKHL
jgi:predicted GIY-YIG superfamily endonuclease